MESSRRDSVREGVVYVPQLQSVVMVVQHRRLDFESKLVRDSQRGGTNCNIRLAGYYDTANTLIDAAQYLIQHMPLANVEAALPILQEVIAFCRGVNHQIDRYLDYVNEDWGEGV